MLRLVHLGHCLEMQGALDKQCSCRPLVFCQDLIREKLAEAKQKQRQAQQGACGDAGLGLTVAAIAERRLPVLTSYRTVSLTPLPMPRLYRCDHRRGDGAGSRGRAAARPHPAARNRRGG